MSIKPIDNNDNDWYNRFFDFGSEHEKKEENVGLAPQYVWHGPL